MAILRTRHGKRLTTALAAAALVAAVSAAPAPASTMETATSGTCDGGGEFTSTPKPGKAVAPGDVIVYQITMIVEGGSVLGCAQDILLSPLLEFVSVTPEGAYFPDTPFGPMVIVSFEGPFDAGTTLTGEVTMRVRLDAPAGATIQASSEEVIQHVVARCKQLPNGKVTCHK